MPTVSFPYEGIPGKTSWAEFTDIAPLADNPRRDKDELMTIIYTSGSTGQPKGVMHSFATINWAAHACLAQLECDSSDRVMSYLPLAHILTNLLMN